MILPDRILPFSHFIFSPLSHFYPVSSFPFLSPSLSPFISLFLSLSPSHFLFLSSSLSFCLPLTLSLSLFPRPSFSLPLHTPLPNSLFRISPQKQMSNKTSLRLQLDAPHTPYSHTALSLAHFLVITGKNVVKNPLTSEKRRCISAQLSVGGILWAYLESIC